MTMNKTMIGLGLALVLPLGASGAATEPFPWLSDLDEAREMASSKDMPMLIVFRCEP